MKILFVNPNSSRAIARVWHNGEEYQLHDAESVELQVQRGDKLTYKVGALAATRKIPFQSPNAKFVIQIDRKAQGFGLVLFFLIIAAMYFLKMFNNQVVGVIGALVAVALFEAVVYFRGYKASVVHS